MTLLMNLEPPSASSVAPTHFCGEIGEVFSRLRSDFRDCDFDFYHQVAAWKPESAQTQGIAVLAAGGS